MVSPVDCSSIGHHLSVFCNSSFFLNIHVQSLCTGSDGQAYQGLEQGKHQVRIVGLLKGEAVYETTVAWENTAVCVESVVYAAVTIKENSAKLNIFIGTPQTTYMCQLDGGMWQKCKFSIQCTTYTECIQWNL